MATIKSESGAAPEPERSERKRSSSTSAAKKPRASGGAGRAAAKPDGRKRAAGGGATGKAEGQPTTAKLRKDLREFVQAHPGGWGHNEWIGLVNLLKERGHDTSDTDSVGMALERERLTLVLERVPGLGPRRVKAIADHYPRIWNVMQAGAEEIATAANIPSAVARRVKETMS